VIDVGKWTRWQDWLAVAAGVYAALSPIWTTTTTKASWTLVVLGIATALVGLWSLAYPTARAAGPLLALIGVLFFISPWVRSFDTVHGVAWTAWVAGVITFVLGGMTMPQIKAVTHRGHHTAAQH
jgi:hypothetical protein